MTDSINPYEAPNANLGNSSVQVSMRYVHLSFWVAHISLILFFIISAIINTSYVGMEQNAVSGWIYALIFVVYAFLAIGLISFFFYFFILGRYMGKLGRSGIAWGGLAFLFSPIGVWATYIASFFVGPKAEN